MKIDQQDIQMKLEERILGSIINLASLQEQKNYLSILDNAKYFSNAMFQEIINAVLFLVFVEESIVDTLSLYSYLRKYQVEISKASQAHISSAYLERDIKDLKLHHYHRTMSKELSIGMKEFNAAKSLTEIEAAKDKIVKLASSRSLENESELLDFDSMDKLLMENLEKVKSSRIDGYSFGISDLDVITNRIIAPKLYVVGALKKSGKTRFIIHTTRELYKQGVPTAMLQLEVPEYDLYKLLKASSADLADDKLRAGNLTYLSKSELAKLNEIHFNSDLLNIECNSGLSLSEVYQRMRLFSKMGAKVVFIDFFQRIKHNINNKVNELENIAQRLADASREFNIAIFILSQLSNLAERETPSISHLKGTSGLAEAADTVMILDNVFRRTQDERYRNRIDCEVTQRYGESGKISLYADLGKSYFSNFSKT